jgi:hypothetical protein
MAGDVFVLTTIPQPLTFFISRPFRVFKLSVRRIRQ